MVRKKTSRKKKTITIRRYYDESYSHPKKEKWIILRVGRVTKVKHNIGKIRCDVCGKWVKAGYAYRKLVVYKRPHGSITYKTDIFGHKKCLEKVKPSTKKKR